MVDNHDESRPVRKMVVMIAAVAVAATVVPAAAQDSSDLSKQLSNPVSSLISVPFKLDYDSGYGGGNGNQTVMTFQPVIPFSIGENWNVISRTIVPYVFQDNVVPGSGYQSGLGNITQSFFFSPKAPTKGGLIWGVGPTFQLPTASSDIAASDWGAGITGVVLKQSGGLTFGALGSQTWSISSGSVGNQFSVAFLQPFVSYSTPKGTSFGLNTESTYNWNTEQWSVPINATVSQIVKFGNQPVQLTAGVRYWADSPTGGPEDWGARLQMTYLFPK